MVLAFFPKHLKCILGPRGPHPVGLSCTLSLTLLCDEYNLTPRPLPRASPSTSPGTHTHVLKSFCLLKVILIWRLSKPSSLVSSPYLHGTLPISLHSGVTVIRHHLLCSVCCCVTSTWLSAWSVGARLLRRSQLELSSPEAGRASESF